MPAGRPPKYSTVEEMQKIIEDYFEKTNPALYTISGLGLALDLDTQSILNYQEKDEFFATIKRAKQVIEQSWELRLINRGNSADIFAMKNFGWKDKSEVENTGSHTKEVIYVEKKDKEELEKHIEEFIGE